MRGLARQSRIDASSEVVISRRVSSGCADGTGRAIEGHRVQSTPNDGIKASGKANLLLRAAVMSGGEGKPANFTERLAGRYPRNSLKFA